MDTPITASSSKFDSDRNGSAFVRGPAPKFADYEILEPLGEGGMGIVYRARQLRLQRLVALKVIRSAPGAGAKETARFQIEAQAIARLQHPNIVQIHEIGDRDGLLFLALELVEGPALDRVVQDHVVEPCQAAKVVETIARAMHHVHQKGIVHRDLKPANVLLAPALGSQGQGLTGRFRNFDAAEWIPKITDFGLAKLQTNDPALSSSKSLLGTPNYMAPEQAKADGASVGPAADVYGLGTILYELLTRRPPVLGNSMLEVLQKVATQEPVAPSRFVPNMPKDLETICLKCLQKGPSQRYASALELADDLSRFLAHEPIQARRATTIERAVKWTKRRPALAGLIAALAVAVILPLVLELEHRVAGKALEQRVRIQERGEQSKRLNAARAAYLAFTQHESDALFHGIYASLFGAADGGADSQQTIAAVRQALADAGLEDSTQAVWTPNPYWSEREKTDVVQGCIQLYLVLSEATAKSGPHSGGNAPPEPLRHALSILDRAAELFPPTQALHLRRMRCLEQLGDGAAAKREWVAAQKIPPTTAIDYRLLGCEQYQRGKVREAAQNLRNALALDRSDFWAHFLLAVCELKLGHPAEADAGLTMCLQRRPDCVWALLLRGQARGQADEFDGAESDYRAAFALQPGPDACYSAHVSRGLMRFRREQLQAAEGDLRTAIQLKPDQFHARITLARLLQFRKRYLESNQEFEQVLRLKPPAEVAAECLCDRSQNLCRIKDFQAALEDAHSALTLMPDHAEAHQRRAFALLELGRFSEAAQDLDQYVSKGGKPGPAFYRARGGARMQLRDYLGARDDFSRALDFQTDADLLCHRGWAYYFADAGKPALRDFDDALRLDCNNVDAYVGRGLSRIMLGQVDHAIADAEEAARRKPGTPEMMHNLACVFAQAAEQAAKIPADKRMQLAAADWRRQAVQTTKNALALVSERDRPVFWRDKILLDSALNSIRDCPEFKELGRRYALARTGRD